MTNHRAPAPTDLPCPVCHARAGRDCIAVDYGPLPSVHGERVETTPLFDALLMRPAAGPMIPENLAQGSIRG